MYISPQTGVCEKKIQLHSYLILATPLKDVSLAQARSFVNAGEGGVTKQCCSSIRSSPQLVHTSLSIGSLSRLAFCTIPAATMHVFSGIKVPKIAQYSIADRFFQTRRGTRNSPNRKAVRKIIESQKRTRVKNELFHLNTTEKLANSSGET